MKIELRYGDTLVPLEIPDANIEQFIRPWHESTSAGNLKLIQNTLTGKEADNFRETLTGKRLCVLTDDATRNEPFKEIFSQLFDLLRSCAAVQFLICTGTHEARTNENINIARKISNMGRTAGISDFDVHIHDCDRDHLIKAGHTSRGTEVLFSGKIVNADIFLVVSDVKVHYFSGYSNPIKNFVPGICSFKTTEQNHRLALDAKSTFCNHPWHPAPSRRDNPVAEDQLEAMQLIVRNRPVYALVIISTSGKISWAQFGPVEKVSRHAFALTDQRNTHVVGQVPRLIVSPGGLPNDCSLYIAQRALELTKNAVANGGEILFLAACPDGIGEKKTIENFYNRLTAPIDQVLKSIAGQYKLYAHKPYKFAELIQRLNRIWIYSQIPQDLIKAAHLYPTDNPQTVVDRWLRQDANTKITVVDGASRIALYPKH